MLNILVLNIDGETARHEYLKLVDQLRENNIKYRQNFNQLVLTTENTRTKFVYNVKQVSGLRPIPGIVCGFNRKIIEENLFPQITKHDPIFYIKQKELD